MTIGGIRTARGRRGGELLFCFSEHFCDALLTRRCIHLFGFFFRLLCALRLLQSVYHRSDFSLDRFSVLEAHIHLAARVRSRFGLWRVGFLIFKLAGRCALVIRASPHRPVNRRGARRFHVGDNFGAGPLANETERGHRVVELLGGRLVGIVVG